LTTNEALNEKVVIQATSLEEVRKLLADAAVQDQVLRAMELGGQVTIDDTGVRVETGMGFKDPERIRSTLNVLCATAACLRTRSAR
jgi:hypothetical protein